MREIKDDDEIRLMQKAIDISIAGHKASMKSARPGMMEYELEAAMEYSFKQLGAEEAWLSDADFVPVYSQLSLSCFCKRHK